jgi:SEC-C motif-containing protein
MASCPCGLGLPYDECCGRFHRGEANAPTAEALMRSRYAAYTVGDAAYLERTWHPRTRPKAIDLDYGPSFRWTGLEIEGGTGGALLDTEGTVRFTAHHRDGGRPGSLRENSYFVRENGEWLYLGPN